MANEAARVCIDSGDHVAAARAAILQIKDADPKLYAQQTAFLPYLTGYVALYAGDSTKAVQDLSQANQSDAYIQCLIGMAYEKAGDQQRALEIYRKAATARGHNPPATFAHRFTAGKLKSVKASEPL